MTLIADEPARTRPDSLRFEVRLACDGERVPASWPRGGRLMVVLAPRGTREPRLTLGRTGMDAPPVLGRDVNGLEPGAAATFDGGSALFPLDRLDQLRPGTYAVQAALHRNLDLNHANAPGDLYSPVRTVRHRPGRRGRRRAGAFARAARRDAAARYRAGQAYQDPVAAPERRSTAGRSTSAPA